MIIFDIETKGIRQKALEMAEPFKAFVPYPAFDPKNVKTGNLKDLDKIAEKIRQAQETYPTLEKEHKQKYEIDKLLYEAKIILKSALSPFTGEVIAIGIKENDENQIIKGDEKSILETFWGIYENSKKKFAGWNIFNFDLPFLIKRSWANGIIIPVGLINGRFFNHAFIDLMVEFACCEYGAKIKLDDACNLLGVEGKFDGLTGADFAEYFLAEDKTKNDLAEHYLNCDINATENVAKILMPEYFVESEF